jgi:hypothetical protein
MATVPQPDERGGSKSGGDGFDFETPSTAIRPLDPSLVAPARRAPSLRLDGRMWLGSPELRRYLQPLRGKGVAALITGRTWSEHRPRRQLRCLWARLQHSLRRIILAVLSHCCALGHGRAPRQARVRHRPACGRPDPSPSWRRCPPGRIVRPGCRRQDGRFPEKVRRTGRRYLNRYRTKARFSGQRVTGLLAPSVPGRKHPPDFCSKPRLPASWPNRLSQRRFCGPALR